MDFLQINPSTVELVDNYLSSVVIVALSSVVGILFWQVLRLYNITIKNQSEQFETRLKREQELQEANLKIIKEMQDANTKAVNDIVNAVNALSDNISSKHKILSDQIDLLRKNS